MQNLTIRRGGKPEVFLFRRKILISSPCSRSRSKGKKFTRFFIGKELSDKTNVIGKIRQAGFIAHCLKLKNAIVVKTGENAKNPLYCLP
ncbi:hypothetical protein AB9R03_06220 [Neisseria gonorrhoeae]